MPEKRTPTHEVVYQAFMRANPQHDVLMFNRFIAKIKADAVREFGKSIDLEATADEWSSGDHEHWAAGNAASAVQMKAYAYADKLEADHE